MMKALSRGKQMMNSLEQVPKVLGSSIHMSTPAQGSLTIPERLLHVPDAEVKEFKFVIILISLPLLPSNNLLVFKHLDCAFFTLYLLIKDPGFFESVEYFFHKACVMAEDNLIDENMKMVRAPREEKVKKAHGILKIIEPCAHVLEVNFPLLRDDGNYEMITGYRAQHSHHR